MVDVKRSLIILIVCIICIGSERFLPFIVFGKRRVPSLVVYLGEVLPLAVMTTLVAYCLRGMTFSSLSGFLPQIIALAATVLLHLWKRSSLLSIFGGTAFYMFLVQAIFK